MYKKTVWKDRIVEKPNTFKPVENSDSTITLVPEAGAVLQEGTPLNAANLNKIENGLEELNSQLEQFANFKDNGGDVGGGITVGGEPLKIDNYHVHCVTVDYGDRVIIDIGKVGNERGAYLVVIEINHNPNGHGNYWSCCNILLTHETIYDTSTSRVVQRLTPTFLSQGSTDFQGITKFIWATTQGSDKELNSIGSAHLSILKPTDVEIGRFIKAINIIDLSFL